jgi:hypothetical protein
MERRKEPRFPFTCAVEGLPTAGRNPEGWSQPIRGTLVDISAGGACVIAEWPVEPQSVLAWRFHFPSVPVPVPVLMQVRGVQPLPSRIGSFRIALAFIT